MSTAIAKSELQSVEPSGFGFDNPQAFEYIQRVAKVFTSSQLVPDMFKGDKAIGNAVIALNMAKRMGADPLAVMQNIYIVYGKPGWSSQFIIACLNSCGRYSPLRFKVEGDGDKKVVTAWAVEHGTNERLEGPPASIEMAKKEGWFGKNGSKWQTMPDLMLRYRAATFFGRLYAPELLMGMQTVEELSDVGEAKRAKVVVEAPKFLTQAEPEAHMEQPEAYPMEAPAPADEGEPGSYRRKESAIFAFLKDADVSLEDFAGWMATTGIEKWKEGEPLEETTCDTLLADSSALLKKCGKIYGRSK